MRPLNIVSLHHPTDEVNRDARTAAMAAIEINIKVGSHDSLPPSPLRMKKGVSQWKNMINMERPPPLPYVQNRLSLLSQSLIAPSLRFPPSFQF